MLIVYHYVYVHHCTTWTVCFIIEISFGVNNRKYNIWLNNFTKALHTSSSQNVHIGSDSNKYNATMFTKLKIQDGGWIIR